MEQHNANSNAIIPTEGDLNSIQISATATLKLPPFWSADASLWFRQVEAQFELRRISCDKTKFNHIISNLPGEIITSIRDIIISPPDLNKYETLKSALVLRTSTSEEHRLQQLLTHDELGDRKPSEYLRYMKQLVTDNKAVIESSVFRMLFMQRLPEKIRLVLAATQESNLEKIAELADKMSEISNISSVYAVETKPDEISELRKEVSELAKIMKQLSTSRQRSRSKSPNQNNASRIQRRSTTVTSTMCWYHSKFGASAKRCQQPCSFQGNDNTDH